MSAHLRGRNSRPTHKRTAHADATARLRLIPFGDDQFRSQYRAVTGWVRDRGGTHWWESRWCESNEAKSNACTCANGIFTFLAEVLEQNPDPKIVRYADFLKRITETKLPWRVKDKASGIEMLLVPPDKFMMGKSLGDTAAIYCEKPAHQVTITNAFYLGRTEVTESQWMKVMGKNPSKFQDGVVLHAKI